MIGAQVWSRGFLRPRGRRLVEPWLQQHEQQRAIPSKCRLSPLPSLANHESPRTTKLYDRRQDEISLDEVERIVI